MPLPYHICFAWTGEYEALKKLLSEDLKLTGIWEQPGGDKKVFRTNDTSISWRKSKSLLHLEGTDVGKITQLLCTKICEDLNGVSKTNNIIISDCSCQTESDISQSCLCKCKISAMILRVLNLVKKLLVKQFSRYQKLLVMYRRDLYTFSRGYAR